MGIAGHSVGRANYVSLDVNTAAVGYIAFEDKANVDKATVVKKSFDP